MGHIITVNADEKTKMLLDQGFSSPQHGIILGYIFPENYSNPLNCKLIPVKKESIIVNNISTGTIHSIDETVWGIWNDLFIASIISINKKDLTTLGQALVNP
jgi:hypothetical protein